MLLNDAKHKLNELDSKQELLKQSELESCTDSTQSEFVQSEKSRIREANALRAAHETMVSLQKQLKQKNELVDKYRAMVQDMRNQLNKKTLEHEAVDQKNKELFAINMREIERYKSKMEVETNHDEREMYFFFNNFSVEELEIIQELQKLLQAKEVLVSELEEKMKIEHENYSKLQEEFENTIAILKSEKAIVDEALIQKEGQLQQSLLDLGEATERLKIPPVKDLSDVVHRLQSELETRDVKISTLNKAIQKLKSQLVVISKELAESKLNSYNGNYYTEDMVQQKILPLTNKIAQLEGKLKKFSKNSNQQQLDRADFEKDMQRLTDELILKTKEIGGLKAEIQELQARLKDASLKNTSTETKSLSRSNSWLNEKTHSKKIDMLKAKLKTKIQETEIMAESLSHIRETLSRSEKDRSRLQTKIQKMTKQIEQSKEQDSEENSKLKQTIQSLQQSLSKTKRSDYKSVENIASTPDLPNRSLGTIPDSVLTEFDRITLSKKSSDDLINIIEHLTTNITKLKTNDSSLDANHAKTESLKNQIKQLKKDIEDYKSNLKDADEKISHYLKLEDENTKLRRMSRKESEKVKELHGKNSELQIANETMIKEIVVLRKVISKVEPEGEIQIPTQSLQDEIAELKLKISEKEKMIQELMNPSTDDISRITAENRKLKREVDMWQIRVSKLTEELATKQFGKHADQAYEYKVELDRLKKEHQKCIQEIDDLKYNYKETLKQNLLLEQKMKG